MISQPRLLEDEMIVDQIRMDVVARAADFSLDRVFRYSLRRRWAPGRRWLMVMLNPSVADEQQDDATTRFCMRYAARQGFEAYEAVNLFALVSTDPQGLMKDLDPTGGMVADLAIQKAARRADRVIVAWGDVDWLDRRRGGVHERVNAVLKMLPVELYCFGRTKHGYPRFPRAIRRDAPLVRYC